MQTKKLSELSIGQEATIEGISTGHRELRVKLQTFGLTKGTLVEVKSVAPFGDPITILVRGFSLSLRMSEAEVVTVNMDTDEIEINSNPPLVATPQ